MPRITPEQAEARRQQILDAARACFLRDGFHQTSMADIQREADLSAGAIYLYFKSKDDIILGIASSILATIGGLIPEDPVFGDRQLSLFEIIAGFLVRADQLNEEERVFSLALQVWAEATRNEDVARSLDADITEVKRRVRRLIGACQERGIVDPSVDPDALSMAMLSVAQGYMVQRTLFPGTMLDRYLEGVRALMLNATRAQPEVPDTN